MNIHQISMRHNLLTFLLKHTLDPFLSKFGNTSSVVIKSFVNDNIDFFREDIVIMEWLHVLEMGVKFENEGSEFGNSRGPHRKAIPGVRESSDSPEKRSQDHRSSDSKPSTQKFREMSKHISGKKERKKRKYKKKQIVNIGWYYEEVSESGIVDFLFCEEEQFYKNVFQYAYWQQSDSFDLEAFDFARNYIICWMDVFGTPTIQTPAIKALLIAEFYIFRRPGEPYYSFSIDESGNFKTEESGFLYSIENGHNGLEKIDFKFSIEDIKERKISPVAKSIIVGEA